MNKYIVHIYREMRLSYADIEADTPQAAAAIAREKPTGDADDIDDCDGEHLSALVDTAGDEDYSRSLTIDFEVERQRKAAPKLLAALEAFLEADEMAEQCHEWKWENLESAFTLAREAIAEATDLGVYASSGPLRHPVGCGNRRPTPAIRVHVRAGGKPREGLRDGRWPDRRGNPPHRRGNHH